MIRLRIKAVLKITTPLLLCFALFSVFSQFEVLSTFPVEEKLLVVATTNSTTKDVVPTAKAVADTDAEAKAKKNTGKVRLYNNGRNRKIACHRDYKFNNERWCPYCKGSIRRQSQCQSQEKKTGRGRLYNRGRNRKIACHRN